MTAVEGPSRVRQEAQDVSGKAVVIVGAGVVAVGVAAVGVMAWMLDARRESLEEATAAPFAAPGRKASPIEHSRIEREARGQALQAGQARALREWGWVEEGKVARIPIDEASRWIVSDTKQEALSLRRGERQPPVGEDADEAQVDRVAGSEKPAGSPDAGTGRADAGGGGTRGGVP